MSEPIPGSSRANAAPAPVVPAAARLAALFPESGTSVPHHWWQRRDRLAIVVVVVIVLLATTAVATSAFGTDAASYRTATVAKQNVDSLITGVATIEPVSQASVAFPATGTVATVDVTVGETVTAGQTLATLDAQSLTAALHQKEATLAQAELTLSKALNGESVGSPAGGGTTRPSNGSIKAASARTSSSSGIILTAATSSTSDASVQAAQQAVLAAQQQVDVAMNTANTKLASASVTCAATPFDATACQAALEEVSTAQAAVKTAQDTLATASTALDTLLQQQAASSSGSSTAPSGSPGSPTGSTGSTPNSGGASSAASSPSSADLVAYQKAVDAATAEVTAAEQAVAQATIVSPIAGEVTAVNLTVGASVTAGSSTDNVIVTGYGGYEVSTSVSVDQIPHVKVGQDAVVLPDGSQRSITGSVVAISAVAESSSTGSATSYRVVIGLSDPNAKLNNGATGTVSIVTDQAKSALAVPTSAVTTNGTRHTVKVVKGGTAETVSVQVGVVGDRYTEIASGLTSGQQVVLATVSDPLPNAATSSSNGTTTRFPGGGGGSGFPGGGRRIFGR